MSKVFIPMTMPSEKDQNKVEKGTQAEQLAVDYLVKKDYHILKRNFRFGKLGELDIVAKERETIVFVEIRSRHSGSNIDPLETINFAKQKKIRRTAEGYLYVNQISGVECRFDVIIIDYRKNPPKIDHLINAF